MTRVSYRCVFHIIKEKGGGVEKQTETVEYLLTGGDIIKKGKQVSTEKHSLTFSLPVILPASCRSHEVTRLLATEACVPHNINPIKWFYRCCCTVNIAIKTSRRTLWEVMTAVSSLGHTYFPGKRTMGRGKLFLNIRVDGSCKWFDLVASFPPLLLVAMILSIFCCHKSEKLHLKK